jgi:hypothetical protein
MAIKWVIVEQGSESDKVRWYGWVRFEKVEVPDKKSKKGDEDERN